MIDLLPKEGLPRAKSRGNLPLVKLPRQKMPPVNRRPLLIIGILFLLAGGATAVAEYQLLPRIEARRVANHLHPSLVELKDSLGEVNTNLGDLFTLISGEEVPMPQTSFLNLPQLFKELKGKVAGESAKFAFYDLLYQLREDLRLVAPSFSGARDFGRSAIGGKVAGTKVTQLEDETTADLQQVTAKAHLCGESVDNSRNKLTLLSSTVPQRYPAPLVAIESELSGLVQESEGYLLEAERTAHYYEVITDVQIGLVPAIISLVRLVQDLYYASDPSIHLGEVDTLAATINSLNQRVEDLSDSLPAGMEKLHADNLTVFTLFSKLLAETKAAVSKDDFSRFDKAVAMFEGDLDVLATRAKTYELDFWQKTGLLKGYGELSTRYDQIEAALAEFR